MDFVYRRISNAVRFKEDALMQSLLRECELKLASSPAQNPVCHALVLDLAGNVLANELAREEDPARTTKLRQLISETFHLKQRAVLDLVEHSSNGAKMSRAEYTKLKTEVLSLIIDELIPLKPGSTPKPLGGGEPITVEELLKRKDLEIQHANALVLGMEERIKVEWEELKEETAGIVADMEREIAKLRANAQLAMDDAAAREAEWRGAMEKREQLRVDSERALRAEHARALDEQAREFATMLAKRDADWQAERAGLKQKLEGNYQASAAAQVEQAKQALDAEWNARAQQQEERERELEREFDQARAEWQARVTELDAEIGSVRDELEQARFDARAAEEARVLEADKHAARERELEKQVRELESRLDSAAEELERAKLSFVAEQTQMNEEWKNQLLAEEAKLECELTSQLTAMQEEKTSLALRWMEQESALKAQILDLQTKQAEQAELDEILQRERMDAALAMERQRSVADRVLAIEQAVKAQRVQFEEEKSQTVSKLCVTSRAAPGSSDDAQQLLLGRALEEARAVHRQLEAITFAVRNSAPSKTTCAAAAAAAERATQVSAFHTPMEKRKLQSAFIGHEEQALMQTALMHLEEEGATASSLLPSEDMSEVAI